MVRMRSFKAISWRIGGMVWGGMDGETPSTRFNVCARRFITQSRAESSPAASIQTID